MFYWAHAFLPSRFWHGTNDFLFMAGSASGYESGKIGRWDNVIMSGVTGYGGCKGLKSLVDFRHRYPAALCRQQKSNIFMTFFLHLCVMDHLLSQGRLYLSSVFKRSCLQEIVSQIGLGIGKSACMGQEDIDMSCSMGTPTGKVVCDRYVSSHPQHGSHLIVRRRSSVGGNGSTARALRALVGGCDKVGDGQLQMFLQAREGQLPVNKRSPETPLILIRSA